MATAYTTIHHVTEVLERIAERHAAIDALHRDAAGAAQPAAPPAGQPAGPPPTGQDGPEHGHQ